jgi:hypothetical protein
VARSRRPVSSAASDSMNSARSTRHRRAVMRASSRALRGEIGCQRRNCSTSVARLPVTAARDVPAVVTSPKSRATSPTRWPSRYSANACPSL